MMRIFSLAVLVLTIVAMWTVAVVLHPMLPARIPLHFDFDGTPDRFGRPDFFGWFLLPTLGTIIPLILLGVCALTDWLLRTVPSIVNVPRKAQLLALPLDARRRALQPLNWMMAWLSIVIGWGFIAIQYGTERVANGAWPTLPLWIALVLFALILTVVVGFHFALSQRINTESLAGRIAVD